MAVAEGTVVRLGDNEWRIGDSLGEGGFGEVRAATGSDGSHAALKFVPQDRKAARELDVWRDVSNLPNVLPLWDEGEWDEQRVLVMPRAECDLRAYLREQGGVIPPDDAIAILTDIAAALVGLAERNGEAIVHRDLKPENILRWNDRWCVADFGIARYAERTTAPETLKAYRSWPYAAPELWKDERAESRTDVYAVGIIAHELLTGKRPFGGSTVDRYKEQHLTTAAPQLDADTVGLGLAGLIESCLRKDVSGRPVPVALHKRLRSMANSSGAASLEALQRANRAAVKARTEHEIAEERERMRIELRAQRGRDARRSLEFIIHALWENLSTAAPELTGAFEPALLRARHGLQLIDSPSVSVLVTPIDLVDLKLRGNLELRGIDKLCFDVIAESGIWLRIRGHGHAERVGAYYTLWYCDAQQPEAFRWYETSFSRTGVIMRREPWNDPERVGTDHAVGVVGRRTSGHRVSSPFTPLDGPDVTTFRQRWAAIIGEAFEGRLPNLEPSAAGEIARSYRC